MKELLGFLLVIFVIGGIMWAAVIGIRFHRAPNLNDLLWFKDIANNGVEFKRPENLTELLPEQGQSAVVAASSQTSGFMSMASQVLGTSVQKAPTQAETLTERAMNYARYAYCAQVVREYEATTPTEE